MVAGFVVSLLGGSRVQIGGPTGAFIVIVYGVVQQYGETGLLVGDVHGRRAAGCDGFVQTRCRHPVHSLSRRGGVHSRHRPDDFHDADRRPVRDGFRRGTRAGDFIGKWMLYFRHFGSVDWANLAVGLCSILLIVLTPRFSRRIPGSLVAIVVLTAGVWALRTYAGMEGVDTIGDRFTIRAELPAAAMPAMDWEVMRSLFPVALTIALLGAIESLLSATVADGVTGDRHDSNTELMAQGAANLLTPLFGGHSGHGCHRPDDDQYQQRRPDARGGHYPCRGAAADPVADDAAGAVYPDGLSCGRACGRFL